ncbi:hypothetical protein [Micromonospora tulbaghiae]
MPRPVVFDLFHTLVHGADDERDRVVGEMALMVGVDPAALVAAYHATWPGPPGPVERGGDGPHPRRASRRRADR